MSSPPSFRIYPGILSGLINLFFRIAAALFLMNLISMVKGLPELAHYICGMLPSPLNTEE